MLEPYVQNPKFMKLAPNELNLQSTLRSNLSFGLKAHLCLFKRQKSFSTIKLKGTKLVKTMVLMDPYREEGVFIGNNGTGNNGTGNNGIGMGEQDHLHTYFCSLL